MWRFRVLVSPTIPLLISVSEAVQAAARANGYRCQRQRVIHPGVGLQTFRPDQAGRALLRDEWGITSDMKLIGLVGRLDPIKGHPVFLEAARILAAKRADLVFVCVGDGPEPYRRQLHRVGAELGLGERLIWAGHRPYGDMPNVYNALDLLCLASRSEGFGNVIAEAMACGVPCVATQVGGVPEIVGHLGILVPPGDPAALARGVLETLVTNPSPDELRQHIIAGFSIEATVEATERELEALGPNGEAA
jgi:glycosyltransferase involved in cell wall biosynthesis